ncbi:MAG: hypothetical protein WBZ24_14275 [Anaerolineales bacterium]|jgi:hypothetical protein
MMTAGTRLLTTIETTAAVEFEGQPSIGDQQADMASASLGSSPRRVTPSAIAALQHSLLLGGDTTRRPRLELANAGELVAWAEADERCPYCKSKGYALHAHSLGNLTRLEGFCRFCGMHTLSLLD